jgi:hypothetical protein
MEVTFRERRGQEPRTVPIAADGRELGTPWGAGEIPSGVLEPRGLPSPEPNALAVPRR